MKKNHTNQSIRSPEDVSSRNHLLGKVVLLMGDDTVVLRSLVIKLAEKGASVALICWQMPLETVQKLKESVQAAGRHFLLIEQANRKMGTGSQLIEAVIAEMGQLDVFIDLSAQKNRVASPDNGHKRGSADGLSQSKWQVTQAVLEVMVHS